MRAARLLDMLLVLQRRGRLTARELSEELEASERTILRDVEALSEAGVPIRTLRGSQGGIELVDGYQTRLTGMTAEEAECLLLVGQPVVARRLGVEAVTRSAQHKLRNALPPALAGREEALATWFVHDPTPWGVDPLPSRELRRIARCVRRHRRLELHLTGRAPITVEPLGLVLKAGSWHLVVASQPDPTVVCLEPLEGTRMTTQRFDVPTGFSLSDFWAAHVRSCRVTW